MAVEKRQIRAAEYRRLAMAAGALAEASSLAHVREKHEQAATRWTELALLDEQPSQLAPPLLTRREQMADETPDIDLAGDPRPETPE